MCHFYKTMSLPLHWTDFTRGGKREETHLRYGDSNQETPPPMAGPYLADAENAR